MNVECLLARFGLPPIDPWIDGDSFQEVGFVHGSLDQRFSTGAACLSIQCDERMGGDWGDIDLVTRRSLDGGRSWDPSRVSVRTGPDTDAKPAPELDRETDATPSQSAVDPHATPCGGELVCSEVVAAIDAAGA